MVEDGRHVLPVGHHGGHDGHHEVGQHDGHNESGQHVGYDDGHESGHDDHHESDHHDGHHGGTDRDLEQAFAEFGSWFCQKKTRSLAKVTTLGSYSTCAGLDINTLCIIENVK